MSTLGKLVPPYPVEHCANSDCQRPLGPDDGAYLFKNLTSEGLCVFCEDCAAYVELNARTTFALVAL
jgi:hypothetical protein